MKITIPEHQRGLTKKVFSIQFWQTLCPCYLRRHTKGQGSSSYSGIPPRNNPPILGWEIVRLATTPYPSLILIWLLISKYFPTCHTFVQLCSYFIHTFLWCRLKQHVALFIFMAHEHSSDSITSLSRRVFPRAKGRGRTQRSRTLTLRLET